MRGTKESPNRSNLRTIPTILQLKLKAFQAVANNPAMATGISDSANNLMEIMPGAKALP
jgi:hypothetical protein